MLWANRYYCHYHFVNSFTFCKPMALTEHETLAHFIICGNNTLYVFNRSQNTTTQTQTFSKFWMKIKFFKQSGFTWFDMLVIHNGQTCWTNTNLTKYHQQIPNIQFRHSGNEPKHQPHCNHRKHTQNLKNRTHSGDDPWQQKQKPSAKTKLQKWQDG